MKNQKKHYLTLIEVLAVISITALLIGIFIPAFSRMMENNSVDRMASNFKTGMEVAQAKAVATRRYVAMILPTQRDAFASGANALVAYCDGGYRFAFVKKDGGNWIFDGWVPGSVWTNMPDGAMLAGFIQRRNWLDDDKKFMSLESEGLTLKTTGDKKISGNSILKAILARDSEDSDVQSLGDELLETGDGGASVSTGKRDNLCGIIFSPFSGAVCGEDPVLIFFTEAVFKNDIYEYANKDNFIVLKLNPITGKVSYLPMEDGETTAGGE